LKSPAGQPPLSVLSCGTDDVSLVTVTSWNGTAVGLLPFQRSGPWLGRIGKGCRPPGAVPMGRGWVLACGSPQRGLGVSWNRSRVRAGPRCHQIWDGKCWPARPIRAVTPGRRRATIKDVTDGSGLPATAETFFRDNPAWCTTRLGSLPDPGLRRLGITVNPQARFWRPPRWRLTLAGLVCASAGAGSNYPRPVIHRRTCVRDRAAVPRRIVPQRLLVRLAAA